MKELSKEDIERFEEAVKKSAEYNKNRPERQPKFIAEEDIDKGYPAFYHFENFQYTLAFYDFDLVITKEVKDELMDSIQDEFDKYCAECKKKNIAVPAPTLKEKLDNEKLAKFKGRLIFLNLKK